MTWFLVAQAMAVTPSTVSFTGFDPVQQWVEEWAVKQRGLRVCYEGAPRPAGKWTVVLPSADATLEQALVASEASDFPFRFRTVVVGARTSVVAEPEPASKKSRPTPSLLDTPIDLPWQEWEPSAAMNAWASALSAEVGERVVIDGGVSDRGARGWIGGEDVPARDLLAQILDLQESRHNIVWSTNWWDPAVSAPGMDGLHAMWIVHLQGVWLRVMDPTYETFEPPPETGVGQRVFADRTEWIYPDGRVEVVPH